MASHGYSYIFVFEEAIGIFTFFFGAVHGDVGFFKQIIRIICICWAEANTYADSGMDFMAFDLIGLAQIIERFLCDNGGILGMSKVGEDDREFVTGPMRHAVSVLRKRCISRSATAPSSKSPV